MISYVQKTIKRSYIRLNLAVEVQIRYLNQLTQSYMRTHLPNLGQGVRTEESSNHSTCKRNPTNTKQWRTKKLNPK